MPFTIDGEWVPTPKKPDDIKKIAVRKEKRNGRVLTVICNIKKEVSESLLRDLKKQCHCGGSIVKDQVELQGDHETKVKIILKQQGML